MWLNNQILYPSLDVLMSQAYSKLQALLPQSSQSLQQNNLQRLDTVDILHESRNTGSSDEDQPLQNVLGEIRGTLV